MVLYNFELPASAAAQSSITTWNSFAAAPNAPPGGISCQGVTSAGIELKWDLIAVENLRGKLSSYKIYYQEVSSLDLTDSKRINDGTHV